MSTEISWRFPSLFGSNTFSVGAHQSGCAMPPFFGPPPEGRALPLEPIVTDRRSAQCVKLGGIVALFFFLVFVWALFVSIGNETATGNRKIYYSISITLCLGCFVSSIFSIKKSIEMAAVAFVLVTTAQFIVTTSFMIADMASPDCETNVIYVLWCEPGEPQSALSMVIQDTAILVTMGAFLKAGWNLHRFLAGPRIVQVSSAASDAGRVTLDMDSEQNQ